MISGLCAAGWWVGAVSDREELYAVVYIEPLQLVERIDAEDIPVAGFQRDVLVVNDDVPDAVKEPFKAALFLRVRHDIKNVNPVLPGPGQQMAGDDRLVTGSGFQATLGLNGDHGAAGQGNQPVRAVTDLITAEEGCAIAVYPSGCAFLLKDDTGGLIIKVMFQRPAGDF